MKCNTTITQVGTVMHRRVRDKGIVLLFSTEDTRVSGITAN